MSNTQKNSKNIKENILLHFFVFMVVKSVLQNNINQKYKVFLEEHIVIRKSKLKYLRFIYNNLE